MTTDIPIIYAYIYHRIKKKIRHEYIPISYIKEITARALVRKRGGIPKIIIKYVIKDLIDMNLLEKIDNSTYKIIKSNCDKKVKQVLSFI